jgi:hypothetical protein
MHSSSGNHGQHLQLIHHHSITTTGEGIDQTKVRQQRGRLATATATRLGHRGQPTDDKDQDAYLSWPTSAIHQTPSAKAF